MTNQNILFGTSSWTYPAWKGLVYKKEYKNEKEFKANSLFEYASNSLFDTVGIDSSFYGPLRDTTLRNYASQVPDDFKWVSKVWEEITIPKFAKHKRYGSKAGKVNENFLNADFFKDKVLSNLSAKGIQEHVGPLVFQFQQIENSKENLVSFITKLDLFLRKVPKEFDYAVEIRNKDLLIKEYFQILNCHKVAHCFNHWTHMPRLLEQMKSAALAGGLEAPFYLSRILTPIGLSYQQAVERFQPYDQIKSINQDMRDDVIRIANRALKRNIKAYVIVNNRSEGCSPKTIMALKEQLSKSSSEHQELQ